MIVDENASSNKDKWSISVPGCSSGSADFNESGNAITFARTEVSTETSESFDITVKDLDKNSGISQGDNSWNQKGLVVQRQADIL